MTISAYALGAAYRSELFCHHRFDGGAAEVNAPTAPRSTRGSTKTTNGTQNADPSDEALIGEIAKGEQGALRALMNRHYARVSRFILRFVNDRAIVEDLAGDTFFAVWQQAPHFERRSSVATWLLAIARYRALSARERRTVHTGPIDEVAEATLVDSGPQPDALVHREDQARFLRQCLSALPAEQALLMELVYYRDKSIKEAALLAGIPESTVKSRMFLARKKIAAMLKAADEEDISIIPKAASSRLDPHREHPRDAARQAIPTAFVLT
jgi:RNA polymerase sigma-70 factor (ECF subfamily)